MKAIPYRKDFMDRLGNPNPDSISVESEIVDEMRVCIAALGRIVNILCQFYKRHKLDSEAVV